MTSDPARSGVVLVVTRPVEESGRLMEALRPAGAEVLLFPLLEIADPDDPAPLEQALGRLDAFDWLIFTSGNGVRAVADRRPELPAGLHIAAVGPATAREVDRRGWSVELVAKVYSAAGLLDTLDDEGVSLAGQRVLLPLADRAGTILEDGLVERGAMVARVEAYRTRPRVHADPRPLLQTIRTHEVAMVTVTSPSTVEALRAVLHRGREVEGSPDERAGRTVVAAIGPTTASAARAAGFEVAVTADPHTVTGLADAVTGWLARWRDGQRG